ELIDATSKGNSMILEHANVTVSNPEESAALLTRLFDWHVRWQGPSMLGGRTVHVGTDESYLALYTPEQTTGDTSDNHRVGGLSHLGILVENLDEVENRVRAEGIEPFNFLDYEPGRRFYFLDPDGIEFEVVSYAA
ncbi:VOC family protein, partial [Acidimicrobiaceae bacterium AH-315-P05]|nr:VOC family protein [Acidimicrobiaceae bacterium AH-315-P05]